MNGKTVVTNAATLKVNGSAASGNGLEVDGSLNVTSTVAPDLKGASVSGIDVVLGAGESDDGGLTLAGTQTYAFTGDSDTGIITTYGTKFLIKLDTLTILQPGFQAPVYSHYSCYNTRTVLTLLSIWHYLKSRRKPTLSSLGRTMKKRQEISFTVTILRKRWYALPNVPAMPGLSPKPLSALLAKPTLAMLPGIAFPELLAIKCMPFGSTCNKLAPISIMPKK
jgi:hypothetical protein